jgi:prevent-host-death family protein
MSINLKEDIKPISYINTNAAEMIRYVKERKTPIVITQNGEAKAVLQDIETYENTQNAFALMNLIRLGERDIESGKVRDVEDIFSDLRSRIAKNA